MRTSVILAGAAVWAVTATASLPPVAHAQTAPEDLMEEGIETLLDGLRQFLMVIPLYGPPELLPNGDILIPRLNRPQSEEVEEPESKLL